jgi:ADP-ribose pyrophosphatase
MEYPQSHTLFQGQRISVLSVQGDRSDGSKVQREVVDHPGAVVILPLLDPERLILIRNERESVRQTLWELPAGTLEKGETQEGCALRELQEETGYLAGRISFLFKGFSTPGFCNEILYFFLAQDLKYLGQNLDETENIVAEPLTLVSALKMVQEGVICDVKTIAALLYFKAYCHYF